MKLSEVKHISAPGYLRFETEEEKKEIAKYIEAPLVHAVEMLLERNIRSGWANANSEDWVENNRSMAYTSLTVCSNTMSEENLGILADLIKQYPQYIEQTTTCGKLGLEKERPFKNHRIHRQFPLDTEIGEISAFYEGIVGQFAAQEKISDNGLMERYPNGFPAPAPKVKTSVLKKVKDLIGI